MRKINIHSDRLINIAVVILSVFGTLMIASATMGNSAGDSNVIVSTMFRQAVYLLLGFGVLFFLSRFSLFRFNRQIYFILYGILIILLILPRILGHGSYGAYGWIRLGSFTVQPAEFAKVFALVFIPYILCSPKKSAEQAKKEYLQSAGMMLIMALVIIVWQKDTGSGIIFAGISYFLYMIPGYKDYRKYQRILLILLAVGLAFSALALSPIGTSFLESLNSDSYMISRFLSSANPFKYQYNIGYHLILSLVASASGGLTGNGYGSSIYKYMNFPNTDNDFILPIIIEELGILGFVLIVALYGIIIFRLMKYAFAKEASTRSKMILTGTAVFFFLHFILNVGGVSGIIPLTGVPLLLISAGGSSTIAIMMAVGICQHEIKNIKERERNANYRR